MNEIVAVILMGFIIGAAAYVYAVVLQMPGEILSFMHRVASVMPVWAHKPLITCQKCVAGQLALWLFPIMFDGYNAIIHVFQVTTSIFFAVVITKFIGDPSPPLQQKPRWTPPELDE